MVTTEVDLPRVYRRDTGDVHVFYHPTPGGSIAVIDGEPIHLVEDFQSEGAWKFPT